MRRGLMKWDESDIPRTILSARTERVQAAMQAAQFDALVIYTNNVRPAAVTYLTAFTPYWSDAILLLPKQGPSVFATSLSKRVGNWIRSTNPVSEIVHTPRPGVVVGARLAADKTVQRVGVLEFDMLPFGIFDDLSNGAPELVFADATEPFATVRESLDDTEMVAIGRADDMVRQALDVVPSPGETAGALLGRVEQAMRAAGAEEVYLAIATDLAQTTRMLRNPGAAPLSETFAISASVALKGAWVRRTRSYGANAAFARAEAWWSEMVLRTYQPLNQRMDAAITQLPGAQLMNWSAERCRGSYPLQVIGASSSGDTIVLKARSMAVLSVALRIDGMNWLASAPFVLTKD